jgi:hypothetical protein
MPPTPQTTRTTPIDHEETFSVPARKQSAPKIGYPRRKSRGRSASSARQAREKSPRTAKPQPMMANASNNVSRTGRPARRTNSSTSTKRSSNTSSR